MRNSRTVQAVIEKVDTAHAQKQKADHKHDKESRRLKGTEYFNSLLSFVTL
jgi:hypothetical protein